MSEQTTETLSDKLFQTDVNTLDNNRVRAKIERLEHDSKRIEVFIERLTDGVLLKATFDKPTTWDDSYPFVRLVTHCGYNASSVEHIVGDEIPIRRQEYVKGEGYEWTIDTEVKPGHGLIDQTDYYEGVVRGIIGTVLFTLGMFIISHYFAAIEISYSGFGFLDGILASIGLLVFTLILLANIQRSDTRERDRIGIANESMPKLVRASQ